MAVLEPFPFPRRLRDPGGFRAEEPQQLSYWKTLEEVPSAAEGRWVAFVRHAQAGHNVAGFASKNTQWHPKYSHKTKPLRFRMF